MNEGPALRDKSDTKGTEGLVVRRYIEIKPCSWLVAYSRAEPYNFINMNRISHLS